MDLYRFSRLFERHGVSLGRHSVHGEGDRRIHGRYWVRPGTSVLIADDSRRVIVPLRKMLYESGYTVFEAGDGRRALDLALDEQPDLILMDMVMPGLNGFQVTRNLRRSEETQETPIIIMSGDDQPTARFWGKRLGADDFLVKACSRGDFFHSIDKVLYEAQHTER